MSRQHHYDFGHVVLRQIFFQNPAGVVAALTNRGDEILRKIWAEVGEKITEDKGALVALSPAGLTCMATKLGGNTTAVIVTLPPPEASPEAYFVALVYRPEHKRLYGILGKQTRLARYVTLELGINAFDGEKTTVLCEWAGDMHLNTGTGPVATKEAFISRLVDMVDVQPE
jgi:hypothetical protein